MKYLILLLTLLISASTYAAGAGNTNNDDYATDVENAHTYSDDEGFQVLNIYFAKDGTRIYYINDQKDSWNQLGGADHETFEVISGRFAKDKNTFYNYSDRLRGVDADTFVVVSAEHGYAGDDDSIYGPHGKIDEADPDTFKMLNKNFSLDIAHVYFDGKRLKGADAGSFQSLNQNYAADDRTVFYKDRILEGVSPNGFTPLGLYTAKDANGNTYFEDGQEKITPDPEEADDKLILEGVTQIDKPNKDEDKSDSKPEDDDDNLEQPGEATTPDSEVDPESEESDDEEKTIQEAPLLQRMTENAGSLGNTLKGYIVLMPLILMLLLAGVYKLFSHRFDEEKSLLTTAATVVPSFLVASSTLSGLDSSSLFGPVIMFALIFFLLLFLIGLFTFGKVGRNIATALLTTFIGILLGMAVIFALHQVPNIPSFFEKLSNPLTFTNLTLALTSLFVLSFLYKVTTKHSWLISIIRSILAAVISIALTVLTQQLFGYDGIFTTVVVFHVFVFVILLLLGMRNHDNKVIHTAHIGRVVFLHFVIMLILALIIRGFLI